MGTDLDDELPEIDSGRVFGWASDWSVAEEARDWVEPTSRVVLLPKANEPLMRFRRVWELSDVHSRQVRHDAGPRCQQSAIILKRSRWPRYPRCGEFDY